MGRLLLMILLYPYFLVGQNSTERYYADRLHSSVSFGMKYIELMEFSGRADDFYGELIYDSSNWSNSKVLFIVKTSSLNTAMVNRDKDLHSKNYMNTENFPAIIFRSQSIFMQNDNLFAKGSLEIKGIINEVVLPIQLVAQRQDRRKLLVFKVGPIQIKRSDYGIGETERTGLDKIFLGNEIKIQADLLFKSSRPEEKEIREKRLSDKPVDLANQEEYEGVYKNARGTKWEISLLGDRLFYILHEAAIFRALTPIGNDTFLVNDVAVVMQFQRSDSDTLTGAIYQRGGSDTSKWVTLEKVIDN